MTLVGVINADTPLDSQPDFAGRWIRFSPYAQVAGRTGFFLAGAAEKEEYRQLLMSW